MDTIQGHLERGAVTLMSGQPLIFPTDTVYGLGVAVGIAETPQVLFELKERDFGKPVAWLVASPEALGLYGKDVPEYAFALARAFWPGPLSIIVKADTNVRESFCAENRTIALRMPRHDLALQLIERAGVPLATTSANISGQKAPSTFEEIDPRLLEKVSVVLRDETCGTGLASTIVDCSGPVPRMVRTGNLSFEAIQEIVDASY